MQIEGAVTSRQSGFARSIVGAQSPRSATPLLLSIIVLFGVSGGVLSCFGLNYNGVKGSPFDKIHPATYLAFAILLWNGLKWGNPVGYFAWSAARRPSAILLAAATLMLFAHIVAYSAPGMAGTLDTFLAPALMLVLMSEIDERGMRNIEITLHVMMTVNAIIGIIEFIVKIRFFPATNDGVLVGLLDTRSTALQGHPLENAAITAIYTLSLLTGCRSLPDAARLPLVGLQFAAMVTFGGRTAIAVSTVLAALYLVVRTFQAVRTGRIPILGVAIACLLAALGPIAVGTLAMSGFFDDLMTRFAADDGGSADARLKMFAIFGQLSASDLLLGPDPDAVQSLQFANGIEVGIENPIVMMLLYHGALITALTVVAVTVFLFEIAQRCANGVWLPMLAFTVLLNSSQSVASKTMVLTKFSIMMLCFYRPVISRFGVTRKSSAADVRTRVPADRDFRSRANSF
jgi:hypothetical protein